MRTGIRIHGLDAPHFAPRGAPAWIAAAVLGLAPLAASSAASPDAPASTEAAASSAVIELVPLQTNPDVTAPSLPDEASAPSDPQEAVLGRGTASYYAAKFDGRRTASGERFDNGAMTAAHRTLPFGTLVKVTNVANGRSVIVRINDRGPFTRGRMIDVSRAAASELGLVARGHGMVELAIIAD